jgi:hypothetical protein
MTLNAVTMRAHTGAITLHVLWSLLGGPVMLPDFQSAQERKQHTTAASAPISLRLRTSKWLFPFQLRRGDHAK